MDEIDQLTETEAKEILRVAAADFPELRFMIERYTASEAGALPAEIKRPKPDFTPTQGQYLAFIAAYMRTHGQAPAETDLQRYFGKTPPTIHQMVVKLCEKGLITRTPRVARSIKLLVAEEDLPKLD